MNKNVLDNLITQRLWAKPMMRKWMLILKTNPKLKTNLKATMLERKTTTLALMNVCFFFWNHHHHHHHQFLFPDYLIWFNIC